MKKIVFLALCLMMLTSVTAYAASEKQISKSFKVANWKGEVPEVPPTDEVAEPANEPEDEHSGDDAKREAKPAEPVGEPDADEHSEPEDDAQPTKDAVGPENEPPANDANPEGEQIMDPAEQEREQPLEDAPPPSEDAIEPKDEQSVFETAESEQPVNVATDEPAPAVDDAPEDDSENEPVEGEL